MITRVFSKPIFRLSVVILVNENILRASPVFCKDIKNRSFARWSSRKPSKVFTPDIISSEGFDTDEFFKSEYTDSLENKQKLNKKQKENYKEENEVIETGQASEKKDYIVLQENDLTFSKLMTQVGNKKLRRKNNLMMLEGKRLNIDAIQAGLKPKQIFFTQKSLLEDLNLPPTLKTSIYKIPYKTVALWSKLESPPGIIGFYNLVEEGDISTTDTFPVKVICDNVRDPGNLGSIIRVAASVGCTEIVLLKGCTDPWDSKVLRSAAGGHFHIPIRMDLLWSQHREFLNPSDFICLADSKTDRGNSVAAKVPQHLYFDVNYKTPHSVAIVVGGETEGLSTEAFKLASTYNGSRLHIPLSNDMESLNSGCALSVVLFEVKRQHLTLGTTPSVEDASLNEKEFRSVKSRI